MRAALLLVVFALGLNAQEYVQAVEFPYYLYPRSLWERELVWLKGIGVRTVAFSIPWNWHQPEASALDLTGKTSPRRDLVGFVRMLRRLEIRAWIRPLPPVPGWINNGVPAWAAQDRNARRQWLKDLELAIGTQVERHGGPIAYVEGAPGIFNAPAPPMPVATVSANDAAALTRSRTVIASARGSLLWIEVEDALYPTGWEPPGAPLVRRGGVSATGEERPSVAALRRDAGLLRHWAPLLAAMKPAKIGKLPAGVSAVELVAASPGGASAVSISNQSGEPFNAPLRVSYQKKHLQLPPVALAPHESLWLPVGMPLAGGLCRECSAFANGEHIVYATAELQSIEYENGILAMEFAAPAEGEVVLQLSRQPSGPFLAAGKPAKFDYDEKTLRARLPVPAGKGSGSRVRIGLAIEPPESSAFFTDAHRLIVGQKNIVATSYSSEQLAARSRLRLPEGFIAQPIPKSAEEIDYEIHVPADAAHGDWADLGIEADGVVLGRAHVQLFRPASIRIAQAIKFRGITVEPPIVPLRNFDLRILNNWPQIQSYSVEPKASGIEILPPKAEVSIGPMLEREISLRPFGSAPGLLNGMLRITGGTKVDLPVRFVSLPRAGALAYTADVDGDGADEYVLETARARAIFCAQDGGRWLEFVWKDSDLNILPDDGALAGTGATQVRIEGGALVFEAPAWRRTVRLSEATLTVEQTSPLPAETLQSARKNEIRFDVKRESPARAIYSIERP